MPTWSKMRSKRRHLKLKASDKDEILRAFPDIGMTAEKMDIKE